MGSGSGRFTGRDQALRAFALDTHLLRRLRPGSTLHEKTRRAAAEGEPFGLPSIALHEYAFGAWAASNKDLQRRVAWFVRLVEGGELVALPVTLPAAILAGRVRAAQPAPPLGKRRQGNPQRQLLGWATDIMIAATTWSHGYDLLSEDSDYGHIVTHMPAEFEPLKVIHPADAGLA